jgi:hypothetical protein
MDYIIIIIIIIKELFNTSQTQFFQVLATVHNKAECVPT